MESAQKIAPPVVGLNERATPLGKPLGFGKYDPLRWAKLTRERELGPLFLPSQNPHNERVQDPGGAFEQADNASRYSPHTSLGSPARLERVMLSVEQRQWASKPEPLKTHLSCSDRKRRRRRS
jgi:hypothetical protein